MDGRVFPSNLMGKPIREGFQPPKGGMANANTWSSLLYGTLPTASKPQGGDRGCAAEHRAAPSDVL